MQVFENEIVPGILNPAAAAGTKFVRLRILWSYVEPHDTDPPTYWWGGVDQAFTTLTSAGFTVIANIYGNPTWAASTACGPVDLKPLSRFQTFVQALVERYDADGTADASGSPRVGHWEISNEQDFDLDEADGEGDYGGCFGGQAAAYAEHLRAASLGAKAADTTAKVIFGGVAYDRFYNRPGYPREWTGPFDYDFVGDTLDDLYANHRTEAGWPFFDWMALHVYNDFRNAWDGTPPNDQELLGKLKHFKNNQLYHLGWYDLRSKPIAVTESSLASMPTDDWTYRSETIQAAYPGQLLTRAMKAGVPSLIWFSVKDHRMGSCDQIYDWMGLGILRSLAVYQAAQQCSPNPIPDYEVEDDNEPKPAYTAYDTAVDQLAGATYVTQLTAAQTGSVQIEAYRFTRPDQRALIVAFTDNGERLGHKSYPPVERSMTFGPSIMPGWTGRLAVTDYLGATTIYTGSTVALTIRQWPLYARPD